MRTSPPQLMTRTRNNNISLLFLLPTPYVHPLLMTPTQNLRYLIRYVLVRISLILSLSLRSIDRLRWKCNVSRTVLVLRRFLTVILIELAISTTALLYSRKWSCNLRNVSGMCGTCYLKLYREKYRHNIIWSSRLRAVEITRHMLNVLRS